MRMGSEMWHGMEKGKGSMGTGMRDFGGRTCRSARCIAWMKNDEINQGSVYIYHSIINIASKDNVSSMGNNMEEIKGFLILKSFLLIVPIRLIVTTKKKPYLLFPFSEERFRNTPLKKRPCMIYHPTNSTLIEC
jgi:hypothetical protein